MNFSRFNPGSKSHLNLKFDLNKLEIFKYNKFKKIFEIFICLTKIKVRVAQPVLLIQLV